MSRKLRELGLSSYESEIYKTLLEYGRLNAKEISKNSSVPKTAVYPNLKSLTEKNLIQAFSGEVSTFEVLKPSIAIPSFVEKKRKAWKELQDNLVKQAEEIFHRKEILPSKEIVQISTGREASEAIYNEFYKKAQNKIYIMGWVMFNVGDKYSRLKDFKELLDKGVDVRIILIGRKDKQWKVIDAYKKAGIKMKYSLLENFSVLIVDGQECKLTLKNRELPDKFNIQVNDKDLSNALESYFLTVWENSEEVIIPLDI